MAGCQVTRWCGYREMDKNSDNLRESQRTRTREARVCDDVASEFERGLPSAATRVRRPDGRCVASCPQDDPRALWSGGSRPRGALPQGSASGPEGALFLAANPHIFLRVVHHDFEWIQRTRRGPCALRSSGDTCFHF